MFFSRKTIFLLLILPGYQAISQGSSLNVSIGYGLPVASNSLYTRYGAGDVETTNGSLGAGLTVNAGYNYKFDDRFGIAIDLLYLNGKTYKAGDQNISYSTYCNGLFISPSLVVYFPSSKFQWYGKFGLITSTAKVYNDDYVTLPNRHILLETTGEWSVGAKTGLGILVPVSPRMNLMGEINLTVLSFYKAKAETVTFTQNGVDIKSNYSISQLQYIYTPQISFPVTPDQNQPTKQLQTALPMSSLALQIGISYNLKARVKSEN